MEITIKGLEFGVPASTQDWLQFVRVILSMPGAGDIVQGTPGHSRDDGDATRMANQRMITVLNLRIAQVASK